MAENGLDWRVVDFTQPLNLSGVKDLADSLFERLVARRVTLSGNYRVEVSEGHPLLDFVALDKLGFYGSNFAFVAFSLNPEPVGGELKYHRMVFDSIVDYERQEHQEPELKLLDDVREATEKYFAERAEKFSRLDAQEKSDRVRGIN